MNREELKKMGLSDEQIESVMKAHGKATNDLKDKADQVEGLESQIDDLSGQIAERDTQLETLSEQVKDNEELTKTIDTMKEDNEQTVKDMQDKLDQQAFNFSLEKSLTNAGVRNHKAVKALLDTDSIKKDGETLLGLDDQLKTVKESDPYLFKSEEKTDSTPQIVTPGNPDGGDNQDGDPFAAKLAKYN